jgi:UDP-3-O-[3-hydroxymyristoyl] glucosamine N-acyltransferase
LPGLKAYIQVERAHYALALLTQLFVPPVSAQVGIHPSALVDPTAVIDPTACVGPYVVIGKHVTLAARVMIHAHCTVEEGVSIGEGSCLHSGVRVGRDVQIGTRCIIQHNSVLGSDGFSYATPQVGSIESARQAGGQITAQNDDSVKIHSLGTLVLGDEVEIGACCTIDRATLGETRIQSGTKIDNQVQIAHNVKIGQNCLIASQTGIAGSCVIGNRVVMAGQVGVADHLQVGDDSILMAQTGVSRSVPARQVMMGTPAAPRKDTAVMIANWHRLDGMRREIRRLSQQLSALEQELSHTSKDVHQ